jgi:hypothetical protein
MFSHPFVKSLALGALLVAAALPAQATFSAGNAVEVTYLYPNLSTVYPGAGPVLVSGPSDSLSNFAGILNIQFTDSTIRLTLTTNAGINGVAFDGLRFVDVNNNLSFAGLLLDTAATNYAQFNASRITHQGQTIFINLVDLPGQAGQQILLSATPVPEPGIWALMVGGLAMLGAAARCQRPGGAG